MTTVRNIRTELGLSQAEFAALLNVTQQAVSQWESNVKQPRLKKLIKIAELGHCSVTDLLKDEE